MTRVIEATWQKVADIDRTFDASVVAEAWDALGPDGRAQLIGERDPVVAWAASRLAHLVIAPPSVMSETGRRRAERRRQSCLRAFDEGYLVGRLAIAASRGPVPVLPFGSAAVPSDGVVGVGVADHGPGLLPVDRLVVMTLDPSVVDRYLEAAGCRRFVDEIVSCSRPYEPALTSAFGGAGFVVALAVPEAGAAPALDAELDLDAEVPAYA